MAIIGRFCWNDSARFAEIENETAYFIADPFVGGVIARDGDMAPLAGLEILPPVEPRKVYAIGLNYLDHAREAGKEVPTVPLMWFKSPDSVIAHEQNIEIAYPDHDTDYEAEFVIVIGKTCRRVSEEDALDYVFGYTNGQDVSDRTIQNSEGQWARAKSFDTYSPLGPFIDTTADAANLRVQTLVNGEVKQDGNTSLLIFKVPQLIAFLSEAMTLRPGDVIYTGTPFGVGPLRDGDVVETRIGDIPPLRNPVINRSTS